MSVTLTKKVLREVLFHLYRYRDGDTCDEDGWCRPMTLEQVMDAVAEAAAPKSKTNT